MSMCDILQFSLPADLIATKHGVAVYYHKPYCSVKRCIF